MDEEEELKHKVGTARSGGLLLVGLCLHLPLGCAAQARDPGGGGLASPGKSHPEVLPSPSGPVGDLCKSSWPPWVPGVGLDPGDEVGPGRPWEKPSAR